MDQSMERAASTTQHQQQQQQSRHHTVDEDEDADTRSMPSAAHDSSSGPPVRRQQHGISSNSHRYSSSRRHRRRHHNAGPEHDPAGSGGSSRMAYYGFNVLLHLWVLAVYLLPMLLPDSNNYNQQHFTQKRTPVLDELHLVSTDQGDIYDDHATWQQIFTNDYWGRPMNSPSSHKSWRPLTVLSFRYLHSNPWFLGSKNNHHNDFDDVFVQRLCNVLTHAALAEAVGILARRLMIMPLQTQKRNQLGYRQHHHHHHYHQHARLLQFTAKIMFALHPTHVEVTANAANRPHLFAVLWGVWLCEAPLWAWPILLILGYLSSETFLFVTVPVAITRAVIVLLQWQPQQVTMLNEQHNNKQSFLATRMTVGRIVLAWIMVAISGIGYYALRYHWDWLSIPDGLIRPAENPFFNLTGWDRIRSYAYITVVHILKAWDWDVVGFSHEYGHACILPITDWKDPRLVLTGIVLLGYVFVTLVLTMRAWRQWQLGRQEVGGGPLLSFGWLLWVMHLSWMVTLFPIAGIVKVGTFVADRIVVPASVGTTILAANWICTWLLHARRDGGRNTRVFTSPLRWTYRAYFLLILLAFSWRRIHLRTLEWMDAVPLLESSLRTCPRSAKSRLEYSKTLSGLYPSRTNLTAARMHLKQVEEIDPNYCDAHQQFAHVAIQEHQYLEFEERLTKALTCPFTTGGAMETWKRYWQMALDPKMHNEAAIVAAQRRQRELLKVIDAAITAEEEASQRDKQSSSPLIWRK